MLELRGVSKAYGANQALAEVSFSVGTGEIVALLGQNGAGKSTLVKVLSGAEEADAGQVLVDGVAVVLGTPDRAAAVGVAIVYQELSGVPHLSVAANISLGREPRGRFGFVDNKAVDASARDVLGRLGVRIDPSVRLGTLSVSLQQVCEIGKALAQRPKIVILDEPTTALTLEEKQRLFQIMDDLRRQGLAILFVTHFLEDAIRMSDRCVVLRDGRLVADEPMNAMDEASIVEAMIDERLDEFYPVKTNNPEDGVALSVRGLRGGPVAGVDLEVHYGEVLGLSGLIGSGRSETVRMIFGADPAVSGSVEINGAPVRITNPSDAIRHGLALITEDRRVDGLCLGMSIKANMTLPALVLGAAAVQRHGTLRPGSERSLVDNLGQRVRLKRASINDSVESLSGGNQQKVAIAKWLETSARIFLFDEPTKGIDVSAKAEVYRVINELATAGAAVVVISSYAPELLGICDRIVVMSRGRTVAEVGPDTDEHRLTLIQQGENVA